MSGIDLTQLLYSLVAVVISITFHEFFHAWLAFELGDPTARYEGRLSLNPAVHFDPMGFIMILFMSIGGRGLGWGKPVPYNPNNLRNGPIVGGAMISVGGPLSNLLLAAVTAIPLRLTMQNVIPAGAMPDALYQFLWIFFGTNLALAAFNLLPIHPLDGFDFWLGVLHQLPSTSTRRLWFTLNEGPLRTYGPIIMLFLVFWAGGLLWRVLTPFINFFSVLFVGTAIY
jgi:Zn-dependent protease